MIPGGFSCLQCVGREYQSQGDDQLTPHFDADVGTDP